MPEVTVNFGEGASLEIQREVVAYLAFSFEKETEKKTGLKQPTKTPTPGIQGTKNCWVNHCKPFFRVKVKSQAQFHLRIKYPKYSAPKL